MVTERSKMGFGLNIPCRARVTICGEGGACGVLTVEERDGGVWGGVVVGVAEVAVGDGRGG